MKRASAAILCIARNEQPYLAEWIEYHLKLGFDHIHLISTDDCFQSIQNYFKESDYQSKISLNHFNQFKPGWQIRCYQAHFSQIEEDWVIVMDLDEYLYLNSYSDIHGFLSSIDSDVGQIQFPWLNFTTHRYYHENTLDILNNLSAYASDHAKSLVRNSSASRINVHSHSIDGSNTVLSSGEAVARKNKHQSYVRDVTYFDHHPCILHFTTRGHFDILNRIIDHQFFNAKSGDTEKNRLRKFLVEDPTWQNLPNRYLLMKVHESLPEIKFDRASPTLSNSTDMSYLLDITSKIVGNFLDFECSDISKLPAAFEEKFHLKEKLETLNLSENCDLDMYFECNTQIEYLEKLRKNLV